MRMSASMYVCVCEPVCINQSHMSAVVSWSSRSVTSCVCSYLTAGSSVAVNTHTHTHRWDFVTLKHRLSFSVKLCNLPPSAPSHLGPVLSHTPFLGRQYRENTTIMQITLLLIHEDILFHCDSCDRLWTYISGRKWTWCMDGEHVLIRLGKLLKDIPNVPYIIHSLRSWLHSHFHLPKPLYLLLPFRPSSLQTDELWVEGTAEAEHSCFLSQCSAGEHWNTVCVCVCVHTYTYNLPMLSQSRTWQRNSAPSVSLNNNR